MNLEEYGRVKEMSYDKYCDYLRRKYGCPKHDYPNVADARPSEGLFIHHIGENEIANLSNESIRVESDHKYQTPEMLCYCDWLEHLLLHIMIGEETAGTTNLGLEGCFTYLLPALRDFFEDGKKTCKYNDAYYDVISGNKDVFDALLLRYNETVRSRVVVQDHNMVLYEEVEFNLEKNNKALVVLGTGLGKTLTAMNYLYKHTCRGLVICPNKLTKAGWERYGEFVDVTTYQSFALSYNKIDYSKYGLVIIDEAHHAGYDAESDKGAAIWSQGIEYVVAHGIKLLGLTATPIRSDGINIGKTVFGGCVCEGKSVEDAIEEGIVHPFSYVTALYDTSEAVEQAKKYKHDLEGDDSDLCRKLIGQLDIAIQRAPKIEDILRKYMPQGKRKGIIFIQNIEDKGDVEAIFRRVYPDAEYKAIDSKMPDDEVVANREWFEKTDEGYLLAVNMISEGAHYKGVNTLIMFRSTASYLVYTQQLGRIITLTKNDDPHAIVFDLVNNVNNISYDDREFKKEKKEKKDRNPAQGIIRALKAVKSDQIIIADEARDIVECLREIKSYASDSYKEWEDNIIRECYPNRISECINRLPGRSYGSISNRAALLNVNNKRDISSYWTKEEEQQLRELYPKFGRESYKYFPNKNKESVKNKAKRLHLSCNSPYSQEWTKEDIAILEKYYPSEGANVKLRLSGKRSAAAIGCKARSLGLEYEGDKWTEEDIAILEKYYPSEGKNVQSRLSIQRSSHCIGDKARSLGLKYEDNKWTEEDIAILKKYYPSEGTKVQSRLSIQRSSLCIRTKARSLGLKYEGDKWTEEDIAILKKYYPSEGTNVQSRLSGKKSADSIKNKARSLGLKYEGDRWTEEDIAILEKYYPSEGKNVQSRLSGKKSAATIGWKARNLGLKYEGDKRPFKILETGETFKSTKDLKEKYPEICIDKVRMCLNGKRRTSAGYHWVFIDEEN